MSLPLMSTIVVKLKNGDSHEFHNAEVALAPPGLYVIQNQQTQLAQFPLGEVVSVLFPDGPCRISSIEV